MYFSEIDVYAQVCTCISMSIKYLQYYMYHTYIIGSKFTVLLVAINLAHGF